MNVLSKNQDRDQRVLELYEKVLEVEQRLIPTGLHVFGMASDNSEIVDLLRMVASFDRPEHGIRSLTNLIAEGLHLPPYPTLLKESASSEQHLRDRERVEDIAHQALLKFIEAQVETISFEDGFQPAIQFLSAQAAVPSDESHKILLLLAKLRSQLADNQEVASLMRALRGEYIEPGPGADLIQNPTILPTGRNTHAVNPYLVPSTIAFERARPVANALLERHLSATGHYPETIAMVLWGIDNIKTEGEAVAQALWLLGVKPRRDSLNRATDVEVIPLEELGHPRIDVVMTIS